MLVIIGMLFEKFHFDKICDNFFGNINLCKTLENNSLIYNPITYGIYAGTSIIIIVK